MVLVVQSCLFATPWTVAHQAPLCMEFSRQDYWSGLPFPSPGVLPDPGIEPRSPALQVDSLLSAPPGKGKMGAKGILYGSTSSLLGREKKSLDSPIEYIRKGGINFRSWR